MKIPMTHGPGARRIAKCIQRAASKSGMTDYQVGVVMTYFIEAIVDDVSTGHPVSIPGFGTFCIRERQRARYRYKGQVFTDTRKRGNLCPAFVPTCAFIHRVLECMPYDTEAHKTYIRKQRNSRGTRWHQRANCDGAFEQFRRSCIAQANALGLRAYGDHDRK